MPKASKKQQRKAEDFKKVKLKVGKKKAPPSNATDTSFTSKSIVLAEQSISVDKSSELTNSRNLTLKDLLSQLRHYSTPIRKDAVAGLADLLARYPEIIRAELGPIIEGSVRLIVDNEPAVRRILLKLYSSLLPELPPRDLAPFVPLIVIFACSAMTHILDDIRADAVRFLDLLSEIAPRSVSQFASKILPNFFSLLETNTPSSDGSRASINSRTTLLTLGNRLSIMRSCYNYLAVYTSPLTQTSDPLWFMANESSAPAAISTAAHIDINCSLSHLYFHPNDPAPFAALNLFDETVGAHSGFGKEATSEDGQDQKDTASGTVDAHAEIRAQCKEALARLFPFLQATWVESATVFSQSQISSGQSLELCVFVMQILQTLWRTAYAGFIPLSETNLVGFLRRCMTHFPFGSDSVGDSEAEEALLSLNIRVSELVAMIHLGAAQSGSVDPTTLAEIAKWSKRTVKFVQMAMGIKSKRQSVGAGTSQRVEQVAVGASLNHESFAELLLVVWQLMHGLGQKDAEQLLVAVMHYAGSCQLASPSKTLCVRFLSKIIELQWSRSPAGGALDLAKLQLSDMVADWALGLPKLMWQLRDRNLAASTAAAETLRLIGQRTRLLDAAALDTLQASLVTLFCVSVPGKGTVFGPFRQYPPTLQRTVLEAVSYCPRRSEKLSLAIRACLSEITSVSSIGALVEEILV
ncbi:rRNA processing protein [Coemansia pectinata]|uniref:Pre-rRNA-processing protein n=1 Tax=Coemansia pectinata TaxID=1052879 RepID=A0A9W8LAZ2_9FUNG|nr:rRNA processing protein [Coemansia pectinata]